MSYSALLPQLVDLSIGTPEVGAVNFNALHKLLHAIVKRLNVSELAAGVDDAFPPAKEAVVRNAEDTEGKGKWTMFDSLQPKVSDLESDLSVFYPRLPSAKEMAKLIKSDEPIADLWQFLSLSKKVDANESGVKTVR